MQNFTNKIYLNYLPDSLDEDEYEPQRGQHHEPHELLLVPERVRVRGVETGHGGGHRGVDVAVCVALVIRHQQLEFLDTFSPNGYTAVANRVSKELIV